MARGVGEKGCRTLRERRADRGVAPPSPGQTRRVQEPAGPRDRKPDPPQPGALAPQPPDKGRNPARTTPGLAQHLYLYQKCGRVADCPTRHRPAGGGSPPVDRGDFDCQTLPWLERGHQYLGAAFILARHLFPATADQSTQVPGRDPGGPGRSEEHTSELQSPCNLVCRLLLEKKKKNKSEH